MTTLIEAAKQALEALEQWTTPHWAGTGVDEANAAHAALRTAIEQAEKNDLERLRDENERLHVENRRLIDRIEVMGVPVGVGGYATTTTTPPAAQRQPLTKEQLLRLCGPQSYGPYNHKIISFARAVEAAHGIKEKNT